MRFHSDESSTLLLLRNTSSMHHPSRISVSCRNKQKPRKNRYQKPIILQNHPISDGNETKEHFLIRAERSIYEGEPMSDDEVETECRLWARTLPHLRICGKSINENHRNEMKSMNEDIIDQLIKDSLWHPFLHTLNKGQQRKKLKVDKSINKLREEEAAFLSLDTALDMTISQLLVELRLRSQKNRMQPRRLLII